MMVQSDNGRLMAHKEGGSYFNHHPRQTHNNWSVNRSSIDPDQLLLQQTLGEDDAYFQLFGKSNKDTRVLTDLKKLKEAARRNNTIINREDTFHRDDHFAYMQEVYEACHNKSLGEIDKMFGSERATKIVRFLREEGFITMGMTGRYRLLVEFNPDDWNESYKENIYMKWMRIVYS